MKLLLNGEPREVPDGLHIAGLLKHLGLNMDGRAVAVNLTFVPKALHARRELKDGDEVEVVAPMQGG
jgi:sulfur carrier protein